MIQLVVLVIGLHKVEKKTIVLNYILTTIRIGNTTLIYKGREQDFDIENWCSITIFSVLYHIIEHSLDQKLKNRV